MDWRVFLLLFFTLVSNGLAADEDALSTLMQRLAAVSSVHAHFRETKHLAILDKPITVTGILRYTAPDYVKKRILLPFSELLEIRGQVLIIENEEQGRITLSLSDYPAIGAFVESFRATLAGDLEELQRFYSVTLEEKSADWHLRLVPRQARMRQFIEYIGIHGRDDQVLKVETLEVGGDRSVMEITPRDG